MMKWLRLKCCHLNNLVACCWLERSWMNIHVLDRVKLCVKEMRQTEVIINTTVEWAQSQLQSTGPDLCWQGYILWNGEVTQRRRSAFSISLFTMLKQLYNLKRSQIVWWSTMYLSVCGLKKKVKREWRLVVWMINGRLAVAKNGHYFSPKVIYAEKNK